MNGSQFKRFCGAEREIHKLEDTFYPRNENTYIEDTWGGRWSR